MGYLSVALMLAKIFVSRDSEAIERHPAIKTFRYLVKPIDVGIAIFLCSYLLATAMVLIQDLNSNHLIRIIKDSAHLFLKWGILWYVISRFVEKSVTSSICTERILFFLVFWFALYFTYCLVQRHTGLNLVHGWNARLGEHRFAYGVYRVSGLTGHPLTLAYNLVLVVAFSAFQALTSVVRKEKILWALVCGLSFLILLISGSRFPLIAAMIILFLVFWRNLWNWRMLVAVMSLIVIAMLDGTVFKRFSEIFHNGSSFAANFDRWRFWQTYWSIFAESPIAGVGAWNSGRLADAIYHEIGQTEKMYNAHNMFLQQMADHGLIGMAGLVAMLGGVFTASFRAKKLGSQWEGLIKLGFAAVICGVIQNNFRDSEYIYAFLFFVALTIFNSSRRTQ